MDIRNHFGYISNIDYLKCKYQLNNALVITEGNNLFFSPYDKYNDKNDYFDFKFGDNYHDMSVS